MVKNLPEMGVQSLAQEDLLEKGMETHSSILAWRIPWTQEPGGLQSTGSQRLRHDQHFHLFKFRLLPTIIRYIMLTRVTRTGILQ